MVFRIILGIFPGCGVSELQDGSRMPQDDLKDHPGEFPWMRRE